MSKTVISALPRLIPTRIANTRTGEIVTWDDFLMTSLKPLLAIVHDSVIELYESNTQKVHDVARDLKFSAAEHARKHGLIMDHKELPRNVKAKSRIARLVQYKLMSETAAYERNPNPRKKPHAFSHTINLGAVDSQMVILEQENTQLILSWKCWEEEYELVFTIPSYVLKRKVTKWSLPLVSEQGFIFTIQESPTPNKGVNKAGVDLGRVEPFTLTVLNERDNLVAEYRARAQVKATNQKRERILVEIKHTRTKSEAYKSLGLDSSTLREETRRLKNKASRIGSSLKNQIAADITRKANRHKVSILHLEDLKWASGSKYGSRWNHGQIINKTEHSLARIGIRSKRVNPRGTSQSCHKCSNRITHHSRNRTVYCSQCKITLDRDVNAALNITKNKGTRMPIAGITGHTLVEQSTSMLAQKPVLVSHVT